MATRRLLILVLFGLLVGHGPVAAASSARVGALTEIRVNEEVDGDVIAIGGDVVLGPDARVHGHAVALFGSVHLEPGAQLDGRAIGLSSLASLSLAPARGSEGGHLDTAIRLATAGGWLLVTTLIAFLWPGAIRRGVVTFPDLGAKSAVLGLMLAITLVAALIAVIGLGPLLGLPLAAVVAVGFLVIKSLGLTVLGGTVGRALLRRITPGRLYPMTADVFIGVMVLLMIRFVPLIGGVAWTVLVLVALGAGVFVATMVPHGKPATIGSGT